MLSAGRVTLSNQTQMLKSDCRAAATDIALALGHPLHRTGRARKKEASVYTVFLQSFLPLTVLNSLKKTKTKQMLGQKAEFPQWQRDILRLDKILVGPISLLNYPPFATSGR